MTIKGIIRAIDYLIDDCHDLIAELEGNQEDIEERAAERERDLTDREQEKWDEYEEQIDLLADAISDLEHHRLALEGN